MEAMAKGFSVTLSFVSQDGSRRWAARGRISVLERLSGAKRTRRRRRTAALPEGKVPVEEPSRVFHCAAGGRGFAGGRGSCRAVCIRMEGEAPPEP